MIYDLATAPFWISLYMRKILFSFFISAYSASKHLSKKSEKLHSSTAGSVPITIRFLSFKYQNLTIVPLILRYILYFSGMRFILY